MMKRSLPVVQLNLSSELWSRIGESVVSRNREDSSNEHIITL